MGKEKEKPNEKSWKMPVWEQNKVNSGDKKEDRIGGGWNQISGE